MQLPEKEKFVVRDIAEASRNLYVVEDNESVNSLHELQGPVPGTNMKEKLIKGMGDNGKLYNRYSFLCWLPHSNFFYLHQKDILNRGEYRRNLLEAVTFIMFYVKKMNGPCGGVTTTDIEATLSQYAHIVSVVDTMEA